MDKKASAILAKGTGRFPPMQLALTGGDGAALQTPLFSLLDNQNDILAETPRNPRFETGVGQLMAEVLLAAIKMGIAPPQAGRSVGTQGFQPWSGRLAMAGRPIPGGS